MTATHLSEFDSRPLTYAVTEPDGTRSFIHAADAETLLAALIPGYESLAAALTAAQASGDQKATQKAHRALLNARRAHAHGLRIALQRQINDDAQTDGTWAALTDQERAELTRAATGAVPLGILADEEVWIAGIEYLMLVGCWDADVLLVIDRSAYGLMGESAEWMEEPVSDNLLALDPTDDDAYVASLEAVGVVTLTDGNVVA